MVIGAGLVRSARLQLQFKLHLQKTRQTCLGDQPEHTAAMHHDQAPEFVLGHALGVHGSNPHTINAIEDLFKDIGLPRGLATVGVKPDHLPALADQAFADACHQTNPVPVAREDLLRLYQEAMHCDPW